MRRLVLAAIAIIGAAFAVPAFAAPVNIIAPLDTRGPLATAEQYPDRDFVLLQPKIFQTRFVYGADGSTGGWGAQYRAVTIDSTIAVMTRGFRQVALLFQFQSDDSATVALFAFQVRGHSNSGVDTLSTYALPIISKSGDTPQSAFTTAAAVSNSGQTVLHGAGSASGVGIFSSVPIGALVTGQGIAPGTYVVGKPSDSTLTISKATVTAGNAALTVFPSTSFAADTIGSITDYRTQFAVSSYGTATGPDTTMLGPGERPLIVTWQTGLVGKNIVLPINTTDGVPFVAPYMSFRLRIMNTFMIETGTGNLLAVGSSDGTTSGKMAYGAQNRAVNTLCEMCGGAPNETKLGRFVTVTADLVGLR